jgi:hypothetical protein
MVSFFASLVEAVFGSLWNRLFPPKTAADQKSADLSASVSEAKNAINISEKVSHESDSALDSDLAKRMHNRDS